MSEARVVVAVDVGGTNIKGALVDQHGAFTAEMTRSTPAADGPEAVIEALQSIVVSLRAAAPDGLPGGAGSVAALSVVVPGVVDAQAGRAEFSANLGFRGVPLREILQQATGLPTALEHDVRAAGIAEHRLGVAGGVRSYVLAVIGTGIAGVIGIDGKAVAGAMNVAGELGHIPVWPDGEACPCGQRGCLERYASAASITRRYRELGGADCDGSHDVVARRGTDPAAAQAWDEATAALGIALTTCTMLLDPDLIVLAGGLSAAADALLVPVREQLSRRIGWREPPPVVLSALGARAGLLGAAVVGWRLAGLTRFDHWKLV